ncbi:MAG: DNA internalization-related competence protein ComEC/Rec2 [Roseburia sp.]|nr:DNA internalization-related competence protein ComEC/Rec2 [Roseburia sp.]
MKRPLLTVCLCLVVAAALQHFGQAATSSFRDRELWEGRKVVVTGRVCQKENQRFYLDSITIQDIVEEAADSQPKQSIICKTKENKISCAYAQISGEYREEPKIGSVITLSGSWQNYRAASNPGEFDGRAYYDSIQIVGKLSRITVLETGERYSPAGEAVYLLKSYFEGRLYKVFPEKEAGILCMLLLGEKEGLDGSVKKLYQRNGIIHILSISGLHITLIGMGLYRLLRRFGVPVIPAALCGSIVLVFYGGVTGMGISACRAIGMYLLRMLSFAWGRTYDLLTALGVLAVVMVLQNPAYLGHAGFLLSFLSVLGIGVLYPLILEMFPGKALGKNALLAGCSVTLMTLPVQLWFYYEVPVWSVCLNLLVVPCVGILVLVGLVVMLIPGAGILGSVDCLLFTVFEGLCHFFEALPFHTWNPGRPGLWQIAFYYGGLMLLLWLPNRKAVCLKWIRVGAMAALICFLGWRPAPRNSITFLDVGQGDCACLRLDSGEVCLFDCGSVSRSGVGEYVLLPFLKYHGIHHLHAVFVSHGDTDHYNGLEELFYLAKEEGLVIDRLVLPGGQNPENIREEFQELLRAAEAYAQYSSLEIRVLQAGDSFRCGEGRFFCLNPPSDRTGWESNAASLCLYAQLGEKPEGKDSFSLLLTGDVEGQGEEELLGQLKQQGIQAVTVLKTAHHGSRYSTSREFLEQITPALAVISCGEKNAYGHPHRELLERLENQGVKILGTPEWGAVTIWREGERLMLQTFLRKHS